MDEDDYIKKGVNWFIRALGIFLLFLTVTVLVHNVYFLDESINQGMLGIYMDWSDSQSMWQITGVGPGSAAAKAGLEKNDFIFEVNGKKVTQKNLNKAFGKQAAGVDTAVVVRRGKQHYSFTITKTLMPFLARLQNVLMVLSTPLFAIVYLLMGLWAALKKSTVSSLLISLICFLMAILYIGDGSAAIDILKPLFFLRYPLLQIAKAFFPILWILLILRFPAKNDFYKKHKTLTPVLVSIVPIFFFAGPYIFPSLFGTHLKLPWLLILFYNMLNMTVVIIILIKGEKKMVGILKKRQYRMARFGIVTGSIFLFFGIAAGQLGSDVFPGMSTPYISFLFTLGFLVGSIGALLIPFSLLNSLLQYRLLETVSGLKKRIRFIAATMIMFGFYFFLTFWVGNSIIEKFDLTERAFVIFFVLLIAITFYPINNIVLRWLEGKIYPERTRYKKSLQDFVNRMPGFLDARNLLEKLAQWMEETMQISPVKAVPFTNKGDELVSQIHADANVLDKVRAGAIFFWDEMEEAQGAEITSAKELLEKNISITIPMIYGNQLVGILNVGKKRNGEDFTGEDLQIFKEAVNQTAIALKNLELQAEQLEKQRMEKELEMARGIQMQLLPHKMPPIDGMTIYGEAKPCYEVGGDYYDIIPMGDRKTVLAVADVSGKGAGTALLMANLQATLRTAFKMSASLEVVARRINEIVFENTSSTQFITLFVCIWNAETHELEYINAGHNPAIVIGTDGVVKKLPRTALGLGIVQKQPFETQRFTLAEGDLLTIFSDGLEEAFNENEESFGNDRLVGTLQKLRHREPVKAIVNGMFDAVLDFCHGVPFHDDLTLMVAKVGKS